jgi:hypothetical protein
MKKLHWMLCGIAIAFAACGVAPETTTNAEGEQVQSITRTVNGQAETCTETFGVCKVGACELGLHDTFQRITEVCCDAAGNCETELYRLCGC